jgi:hypothetical protein
VDKAYCFQFQNEEDIVKWKWCGKGKYTTNQCMTTLQKMMLAIVTSTFGKAKYLTKLRYSLG